MFEFDNGLALINIDDARTLYRLDGVTGVRLKLDDMFEAPQVASDLLRVMPVDAEVRDWTRSHANFFRAVQIEKRVMFIILTLIIAVAAFNIVSAQVMTVTDKQPDIAILRTLGASPRSILAIFVIQGALIGMIGTAIGVIGGVLLALNVDVVVPAIERAFSIQFLDKSVYYISELPSDLQRGDVITIAAIALVLALLATLYPAWRAARVNPAEALRYE
jgi:lipoprotein-releasing system permease protein